MVLEPMALVRYRRAGGGRGGGLLQYPPVALPIDYMLPETFSGPIALEIRDGGGRLVRRIQPAAGGRGRGGDQADPDMRGGRGRGGAAPMTARAGHNRYLWDYRWDNGGPLVAPGKYRVRLLTGAAASPSPDPSVGVSTEGGREFEVKVDPGVLADGITAADLVEQQNFLLQVRDAQAAARQLQQRLQQAMQKAGVKTPPSPGPGEWVGTMKYEHPLQGLWARVVTAPGTYEQGMLIDQLSNIMRAEGGADQKVGAESRRRFEDLTNEMKAIEAELARINP